MADSDGGPLLRELIEAGRADVGEMGVYITRITGEAAYSGLGAAGPAAGEATPPATYMEPYMKRSTQEVVAAIASLVHSAELAAGLTPEAPAALATQPTAAVRHAELGSLAALSDLLARPEAAEEATVRALAQHLLASLPTQPGALAAQWLPRPRFLRRLPASMLGHAARGPVTGATAGLSDAAGQITHVGVGGPSATLVFRFPQPMLFAEATLAFTAPPAGVTITLTAEGAGGDSAKRTTTWKAPERSGSDLEVTLALPAPVPTTAVEVNFKQAVWAVTGLFDVRLMVAGPTPPVNAAPLRVLCSSIMSFFLRVQSSVDDAVTSQLLDALLSLAAATGSAAGVAAFITACAFQQTSTVSRALLERAAGSVARGVECLAPDWGPVVGWCDLDGIQSTLPPASTDRVSAMQAADALLLAVGGAHAPAIPDRATVPLPPKGSAPGFVEIPHAAEVCGETFGLLAFLLDWVLSGTDSSRVCRVLTWLGLHLLTLHVSGVDPAAVALHVSQTCDSGSHTRDPMLRTATTAAAGLVHTLLPAASAADVPTALVGSMLRCALQGHPGGSDSPAVQRTALALATSLALPMFQVSSKAVGGVLASITAADDAASASLSTPLLGILASPTTLAAVLPVPEPTVGAATYFASPTRQGVLALTRTLTASMATATSHRNILCQYNALLAQRAAGLPTSNGNAPRTPAANPRTGSVTSSEVRREGVASASGGGMTLLPGGGGDGSGSRQGVLVALADAVHQLAQHVAGALEQAPTVLTLKPLQVGADQLFVLLAAARMHWREPLLAWALGPALARVQVALADALRRTAPDAADAASLRSSLRQAMRLTPAHPADSGGGAGGLPADIDTRLSSGHLSLYGHMQVGGVHVAWPADTPALWLSLHDALAWSLVRCGAVLASGPVPSPEELACLRWMARPPFVQAAADAGGDSEHGVLHGATGAWLCSGMPALQDGPALDEGWTAPHLWEQVPQGGGEEEREGGGVQGPPFTPPVEAGNEAFDLGAAPEAGGPSLSQAAEFGTTLATWATASLRMSKVMRRRRPPAPCDGAVAAACVRHGGPWLRREAAALLGAVAERGAAATKDFTPSPAMLQVASHVDYLRVKLKQHHGSDPAALRFTADAIIARAQHLLSLPPAANAAASTPAALRAQLEHLASSVAGGGGAAAAGDGDVPAPPSAPTALARADSALQRSSTAGVDSSLSLLALSVPGATAAGLEDAFDDQSVAATSSILSGVGAFLRDGLAEGAEARLDQDAGMGGAWKPGQPPHVYVRALASLRVTLQGAGSDSRVAQPGATQEQEVVPLATVQAAHAHANARARSRLAGLRLFRAAFAACLDPCDLRAALLALRPALAGAFAYLPPHLVTVLQRTSGGAGGLSGWEGGDGATPTVQALMTALRGGGGGGDPSAGGDDAGDAASPPGETGAGGAAAGGRADPAPAGGDGARDRPRAPPAATSGGGGGGGIQHQTSTLYGDAFDDAGRVAEFDAGGGGGGGGGGPGDEAGPPTAYTAALPLGFVLRSLRQLWISSEGGAAGSMPLDAVVGGTPAGQGGLEEGRSVLSGDGELGWDDEHAHGLSLSQAHPVAGLDGASAGHLRACLLATAALLTTATARATAVWEAAAQQLVAAAEGVTQPDPADPSVFRVLHAARLVAAALHGWTLHLEPRDGVWVAAGGVLRLACCVADTRAAAQTQLALARLAPPPSPLRCLSQVLAGSTPRRAVPGFLGSAGALASYEGVVGALAGQLPARQARAIPVFPKEPLSPGEAVQGLVEAAAWVKVWFALQALGNAGETRLTAPTAEPHAPPPQSPRRSSIALRRGGGGLLPEQRPGDGGGGGSAEFAPHANLSGILALQRPVVEYLRGELATLAPAAAALFRAGEYGTDAAKAAEESMVRWKGAAAKSLAALSAAGIAPTGLVPAAKNALGAAVLTLPGDAQVALEALEVERALRRLLGALAGITAASPAAGLRLASTAFASHLLSCVALPSDSSILALRCLGHILAAAGPEFVPQCLVPALRELAGGEEGGGAAAGTSPLRLPTPEHPLNLPTPDASGLVTCLLVLSGAVTTSVFADGALPRDGEGVSHDSASAALQGGHIIALGSEARALLVHVCHVSTAWRELVWCVATSQLSHLREPALQLRADAGGGDLKFPRAQAVLTRCEVAQVALQAAVGALGLLGGGTWAEGLAVGRPVSVGGGPPAFVTASGPTLFEVWAHLSGAPRPWDGLLNTEHAMAPGGCSYLTHATGGSGPPPGHARLASRGGSGGSQGGPSLGGAVTDHLTFSTASHGALQLLPPQPLLSLHLPPDVAPRLLAALQAFVALPVADFRRGSDAAGVGPALALVSTLTQLRAFALHALPLFLRQPAALRLHLAPLPPLPGALEGGAHVEQKAASGQGGDSVDSDAAPSALLRDLLPAALRPLDAPTVLTVESLLKRRAALHQWLAGPVSAVNPPPPLQPPPAGREAAATAAVEAAVLSLTSDSTGGSSGGTLQRTASGSFCVESPHATAAAGLALATSMPEELCEHTLDMFDGNVAMARGWLEHHGAHFSAQYSARDSNLRRETSTRHGIAAARNAAAGALTDSPAASGGHHTVRPAAALELVAAVTPQGPSGRSGAARGGGGPTHPATHQAAAGRAGAGEVDGSAVYGRLGSHGGALKWVSTSVAVAHAHTLMAGYGAAGVALPPPGQVHVWPGAAVQVQGAGRVAFPATALRADPADLDSNSALRLRCPTTAVALSLPVALSAAVLAGSSSGAHRSTSTGRSLASAWQAAQAQRRGGGVAGSTRALLGRGPEAEAAAAADRDAGMWGVRGSGVLSRVFRPHSVGAALVTGAPSLPAAATVTDSSLATLYARGAILSALSAMTPEQWIQLSLERDAGGDGGDAAAQASVAQLVRLFRLVAAGTIASGNEAEVAEEEEEEEEGGEGGGDTAAVPDKDEGRGAGMVATPHGRVAGDSVAVAVPTVQATEQSSPTPAAFARILRGILRQEAQLARLMAGTADGAGAHSEGKGDSEHGTRAPMQGALAAYLSQQQKRAEAAAAAAAAAREARATAIAEARLAFSTQPWACERCTFVNEPHSVTCEMCEGEKPEFDETRVALPPGVGGGDEGDSRPASTMSHAALGPVTRALVDECIPNIVGATSAGGLVAGAPRIVETLHPLPSPLSFNVKHHFPGASAICVVFDPRCALPCPPSAEHRLPPRERTIPARRGVPGVSAWISLAGKAGTMRTASESVASATSGRYVYGLHFTAAAGAGGAVPPLIVSSDTLAISVVCNETPPQGSAGMLSEFWGVRLTLVPMGAVSWLSERQVLHAPSFEFGVWLLRFLATSAPEVVSAGALHDPAIFNALAKYLCTPGLPFKERVVPIMAQLLATPNLFLLHMRDASALHLSLLTQDVYGEVQSRLEDIQTSSRAAPPPALLQLLQLCVMARRAEACVSSALRLALSVEDADPLPPAPTSMAEGRAHVPELTLGRRFKDMPLHERLVEVLDLATALRRHRRLPDVLLCKAMVVARGTPAAALRTGRGRWPFTQSEAIAAQVHMSRWSVAQDALLADWLQAKARTADVPEMHLDISQLAVSAEDARKFPGLADVDILRVRERAALIMLLNKRVESVLQYVDDTDSRGSGGGGGGGAAAGGGAPPTAGTGAGGFSPLTFDSPLVSAADAADAAAALLEGEASNSAARPAAPSADSATSWSLGSRLRDVSHCVFMSSKLPAVKRAIDDTTSDDSARLGVEVHMHTGKARASRAEGNVAPRTSECMFVQLATKLRTAMSLPMRPGTRAKGHGVGQTHASLFGYTATGTVSATALADKLAPLRTKPHSSRKNLFNVRFEDFDARGRTVRQAGLDWGGLFNEMMTEAVADLFRVDTLSLFLPATRASARLGQAGTFVPNPALTSPYDLALFEMVGVLMGIAVRMNKPQPFPLASIVWRCILGLTPSPTDLEAADEAAVSALRQRLAATVGGSDEELAALGDTAWEAVSVDGTRVPLQAPPGMTTPTGGVPPTPAAVRAHATACLAFRLREFEPACAAMQRGLDALLPMRVLRTFTPAELSFLVQGEATIDVDRLRSHTKYAGQYNSNHPVVKRFWRVLDSFDEQLKVKFIRFAWGRGRLPPPGQWPDSLKFKLGEWRRTGQDPDKALMIAATCEFAVYLPTYSTDAVMRERMTLALSSVEFGTFDRA